MGDCMGDCMGDLYQLLEGRGEKKCNTVQRGGGLLHKVTNLVGADINTQSRWA